MYYPSAASGYQPPPPFNDMLLVDDKKEITHSCRKVLDIHLYIHHNVQTYVSSRY